MGAVLGTPGHMSPEQAAGRLDLLGPTSDVYGLVATVYHFLTGQPPFRAKLSDVLKKAQRLFIQGFTQLDIDTAGNPVRGDLMAMSLQLLGMVQDPTLLFLDLSVGYWMHDDPSRPWITGFAPNDAGLIQRS